MFEDTKKGKNKIYPKLGISIPFPIKLLKVIAHIIVSFLGQFFTCSGIHFIL